MCVCLYVCVSVAIPVSDAFFFWKVIHGHAKFNAAANRELFMVKLNLINIDQRRVTCENFNGAIYSRLK